jgi:hypothetical protein
VRNRTLLPLIILALLLVVVVVPRPVDAQTPFGGVVTVVSDIPRIISENASNLVQHIKDQLKQVADLSFKNGLKKFFNKQTEENLLKLATGNPGQTALFLSNPFRSFQQAGQSAGFDYLDKLANSGTTRPLPPGGIQTQISVQRLVRGILENDLPVAQCRDQCQKDSTAGAVLDPVRNELKAEQILAQKLPNELTPCGPLGITVTHVQCVEDLRNYIRSVQQAADAQIKQCNQKCATAANTPGDIFSKEAPVLQGLANADVYARSNEFFAPTGNPIGQLLAVYNSALNKSGNAIQAARDTANSAVGPLVSTISGEIKLPSTGAAALLTQSIVQATTPDSFRTGSVLADAFDILSKTLISRLRDKLFSSPCGLNLALCKGPTSSNAIGNLLFGSGAPTGIAGAALQFSSIGQANYQTGDPAKTPVQPADVLQSMGLIDSQFRQAVEEKITVQEALDANLLDGGRTFGFDQNGKEPADGYPYRALVYLRKYRIVPVGWELAAQYNRDFDRKNYSLKQMTEAFAQCGQGVCSNNSKQECTPGAAQSVADQECGGAPGTSACVKQSVSPYCGLVDPNWVLKAPATFCRRQGAGEEIVSRQFVCDDTNGDGKVNCDTSGADIGHWDIQRKTDTCSDEQSCIAENPDGSCRAYGYCVAERASFRFAGTQCSPEEATCTTFTDTSGTATSYLAGTLDTRGCSAASAGCQWYCSTKDPNGNWICAAKNGVPSGGSCSNNPLLPCTPGSPTTASDCGNSAASCVPTTNSKYNSSVGSCDPSAAGCKQFLRTVDGANLLPNGNVERYVGNPNDGAADTYTFGGSGWTTTGGAVAQAVTGDTPSGSTTALQLTGSGALEETVETGTPAGDRSFAFSFAARAASGSCSNGRFGLEVAGGAYSARNSGTASYTPTWSRYSFVTPTPIPAGVSGSQITVNVQPVGGCTLVIDDLKLEEGTTPTTYRDYGADQIHLLGTRTQCPVAAVGCQQYNPKAGGSPVPGIVHSADICPASDVGCRAFTELPVTDNGADPTLAARSTSRAQSLVPTTGTACSAADVGCEEYTNLDTVASGGEGREYYRLIKQCVKPIAGDANQLNYYTWSGSDDVGFHLEAFTLKKSNLNAGPCTNLAYGTTSNSNPNCSDTAATAFTCAASDVGVNPDCRDYFNQTLNHFYILASKVIEVTNDCHPYRNTLDDANGNSIVYNIIPSQSISCGAGAAQCRAYKGSASANTTAVFTDDFESGTTANWTGGTISNTSISVGGHSMLVAGGSPPLGVYTVPATYVTDGATYTVTFWAAGNRDSVDTTVTARFAQQDESGIQSFSGTAAAKGRTAGSPPTYHWNQYTLGPVTVTGDPSSLSSLRFWFVGSGEFLVDNVVVSQVVDNIYLVRDSYQLCTGNENCAAYTNSKNQTVNLKSFSGLCQEQFLGCEAVYDTQNSSNPYAESVFVRGDTGIVIPADNITYLVNDPHKYCRSTDKGCTNFGQPIFDEKGAVKSFDTVTLKDDPDAYQQILCLDSELMCQQFTTSTGAAYFKDPGLVTCEFTQPPGLPEAWYRTGTTTPCSTATGGGFTYRDQTLDRCEVRTVGGTEQFCYRSSPDGLCVPCVARTCSDAVNGCTEYLDPSNPPKCQPSCAYSETNGVPNRVDTKCRVVNGTCSNNPTLLCGRTADCNLGGGSSTCNPSAVGLVGCRGYYQLKQTVDAGACNGILDPLNGCRAFNDTSGGTLNIRTSP